jgi:hypothetical protein
LLFSINSFMFGFYLLVPSSSFFLKIFVSLQLDRTDQKFQGDGTFGESV